MGVALTDFEQWIETLKTEPEPPTPQPYPYQIDGINILYEKKRMILNDPTGRGKTVQAILAAKCWGAIRTLVVVRSKLRWKFVRELQKWYPEAPYIVVEGTEKEKLEQIRTFEWGFLIVAYEFTQAVPASRLKKWEATYQARVAKAHERGDLEPKKPLPPVNWAAHLMKKKFQVVMWDEAHCLRNRHAYWTVGAFQLADKAEAVIPITASAVQTKVINWWPLLRIVDKKAFSSFWEFAKEFAGARPGPFGWEMQDHPTKPASLSARIAPYVLRRDDAIDLPPVTEIDVWVDMEGEQQRLYSEIESDMITRIAENDFLVTPIVLSQLTRLRQIAISPSLVGGKGDSCKLDALRQLVEPLSEKVLVVTQFFQLIPYVTQLLDSLKLTNTWVAGSSHLPDSEFERRIARFQEDPNLQILVGQIDCIGEGQDLFAGSVLIRLDKSFNPVRNQQVRGRLERIGQTRPVTIYNILTRNSRDEWLETKLTDRENMIDQFSLLLRQRYEQLWGIDSA